MADSEKDEEEFAHFASSSRFVDALINLAGREDEAGQQAVTIMGTFTCQHNNELLYKTPGYFDALMNKPHTAEALDVLCSPCDWYGSADMLMELATNAALVELFVCNAGTSRRAIGALANLCGWEDRQDDNEEVDDHTDDAVRKILYDYPSPVDTAIHAIYTTPDCGRNACKLLEGMTKSDDLKKPIVRNSKIIDALVHEIVALLAACMQASVIDHTLQHLVGLHARTGPGPDEAAHDRDPVLEADREDHGPQLAQVPQQQTHSAGRARHSQRREGDAQLRLRGKGRVERHHAVHVLGGVELRSIRREVHK